MLLIVLGCGGAALEDLAALPAGPGTLVAMFPADGARNMGGRIATEVVLGAEAEGRLPKAGWVQGAVEGSLWCTHDGDVPVASCGTLPQLLAAEEGVDAWAELDPTRLDARLSPGAPVASWAWELGVGGTHSQIGGDATAGALLDGALGDLGLVGVIDGYSGAPVAGDLVLGPVEHTPEEGVRRPLPPGFSMVLKGEVHEDGRLVASADAAWLPVGSGPDTPHLLLLDVKLEGTPAGRGLDPVVLEARLPVWTLLHLAEHADVSANTLATTVQLDLDWDGDGAADSASLRLQTAGAFVTLTTW